MSHHAVAEAVAEDLQSIIDTLENSALEWDITSIEKALEKAWDDFDAADGTAEAVLSYVGALEVVADTTIIQAAQGGDYNRDLGPEELVTDYIRTRDARYAREIADAARTVTKVAGTLRAAA